MATQTNTLPRNMRGARWLNDASYLTADDRALVLAKIAECKRAFPEDAGTVGVRPSPYIGDDLTAIADVIYGPGGCRLYGSVYRPRRLAA